MRPKVSVFIAVSLDGFIARNDGALDWLDQANAGAAADEDTGYAAFIAMIDVLVMGRHTYEKVLGFGQWPYGGLRVIVLSTTGVTIPEAIRQTVESSKEDPRSLLERLAKEGCRHVYVDGGITIQAFLAGRLVDDLTITTLPVLLGSGKPLFGDLGRDIWLAHQHTKVFDSGFVQTRYCVRDTPH